MPASAAPDGRTAVVVITRDRVGELLGCLERLVTLPEQPHVVVVDNGSSDGTAGAVSASFPQVEIIALSRNMGAVGRNIGVERLDVPYVAFCDDDTWWDPGALALAADVLDQHPRVGVVTGHIVVEPGGREDPICAELRSSPLASDGLPGPALLSFLAGASVVRRSAFAEAGGFHPRLHLGGEEELLAVDLATAGWSMVHVPEVIVHHHPSPARDPRQRRQVGIRNTLWFMWLRRPWPSALRRTARMLATLPRDRTSAAGIAAAVAGLPWVLRERRTVPPAVEAGLRLLDEPQLRSPARRYVS